MEKNNKFFKNEKNTYIPFCSELIPLIGNIPHCDIIP